MDLKNLPYRLHTLYNHLVVIADDMYTSSVFLCVSEKGSQMRLLRMAAYRFLIELTNARRLQEKFLIDIIRLDLIDVRGKLHNLISYLIQHDCDLPLLYRYNKGEEFMTYAQDIVEEENLDNEVPDDERSKEAMKVRQIEIEKYRSNFDDFRDCIERICDVIDKLLDDAQSLHRDENAMLMRMGEMEDYYIRNQWQKDMKELNATIEMVRNKYMDKHFNDIQILVFVQNELLYDNVNGIGHNELYTS